VVSFISSSGVWNVLHRPTGLSPEAQDKLKAAFAAFFVAQ